MNTLKDKKYQDGEKFLLPSKTNTIGYIPLRQRIEQALIQSTQLQPQYDGFDETKITPEELAEEKRLARYQDCDLADRTENAAELSALEKKIKYVKKKPTVSEKKTEVLKTEQSEVNKTSGK